MNKILPAFAWLFFFFVFCFCFAFEATLKAVILSQLSGTQIEITFVDVSYLVEHYTSAVPFPSSNIFCT
jgi:hypothetical protein